MSLQIGALMIFVDDLELVKSFFNDTLGLKMFGSKPHWAGFKAGEVLIELFGPGHRGPDVGVAGIPGVKEFSAQPVRISFKTEEIQKEVTALKSKGAKLLTEIGSESWGKYVWVADPEGNQHQLWQPASK